MNPAIDSKSLDSEERSQSESPPIQKLILNSLFDKSSYFARFVPSITQATSWIHEFNQNLHKFSLSKSSTEAKNLVSSKSDLLTSWV